MTKIAETEAADLTETLWKARAEGLETDAHCGWCEFSVQVGLSACRSCPVRRVAGKMCSLIEAYADYRRAETKLECRAAAAAVYALLIENRPQLLLAARKILDETYPA